MASKTLASWQSKATDATAIPLAFNSLASFILSAANLYLHDEPFNNLDRKTTDLLQEIFDMKINAGAKIIFSSHDRSSDDFPLIDMNLFN